jgi:hypothetical protein
MEIGGQPLVLTPAPIEPGEGVARLLRELQPGARVIATVETKLAENAYLLKLGGAGASVRAQGPAGLVAGQALTLEVVTREGIPHLKLLPPEIPQNAEAAAVRQAFRQFLPMRQDLAGIADSLRQTLAAGTASPLPDGLGEKIAALLESLPRLTQLTMPEGLRRAVEHSGLFFEAKAAGAFDRSSGPADFGDFKGRLLALAENLRASLKTAASGDAIAGERFALVQDAKGQGSVSRPAANGGMAEQSAPGAKTGSVAANFSDKPGGVRSAQAPSLQTSAPRADESSPPGAQQGSSVANPSTEAGIPSPRTGSRQMGEAIAKPASSSVTSEEMETLPAGRADERAGKAPPSGVARSGETEASSMPERANDPAALAVRTEKTPSAALARNETIAMSLPILASDDMKALARRAEIASNDGATPSEADEALAATQTDGRAIAKTSREDSARTAERPAPEGNRQALVDEGATSLKPGGRPAEDDAPARLSQTPNDGQDLKTLLHKTEGVLAKLALDQLASLPSNEGGQTAWRLEIPFFGEDGRADALKLKFSKEGGGARRETKEETWSVLLELNPPGLGAVHGRIALRGGRVDAWLWSDRPETSALIRSHLYLLAARLRQAGVETGRIDALEQAPPNFFDDAPAPGVPLLSERA